MIDVCSVSKKFGPITAVNDVSFSVRKGEVLGFLGPNGAGKSTTIRIIAGYIQPTSGTVMIDGQNITSDPIAAKRRIGYMPETTPLYKEMTAREYLLFVAEVHGMPLREQRVQEIIQLANLETIKNQLVETISKGYRSRLNFAAAILHNPEILLLDEPTDGLDPNQKNEIRGLIKSLSKDKAIIVSTHILEEVEAMCDRVIIISEGHLVLDGSPSELRSNTASNNRVVVCIKTDQRKKAAGALETELFSLGARTDGFERFRVENSESIGAVTEKLGRADVACEEIFYYDAPLDEAFGHLTVTKE